MSQAPPILTTPAAPLKLRVRATPSIRFMEAFTWLFENPKWGTTSAIAAVILNFPLFPLPILGQIVVMGYLFSCLEDELRQPRFGYADFDTKKLGAYLKRGIFPWLVNLVITSVGVGIALMFFFPMMMAGVALLNTQDELWMMLGGVVIGLGYLFYIGFLILVTVAPIPLLLRVGITQNIKDALEIRWAISFLRKLMPELVLVMLVVDLALVPLMLLGFFACIIGMWFIAAWLYFVGFRLLLQLYEIFLARGGEPIPLPALPPPLPLFLPTEQLPGEKISPFMPPAG